MPSLVSIRGLVDWTQCAFCQFHNGVDHRWIYQKMTQDLLHALLQIPCPSGREERMATFVGQSIEALGFTAHSDAQGNVWTLVDGSDKAAGAVAMARHMDEIAMVVHAIEDDGTLRVQRSGGLHPWKLGEGPVVTVGDGESLCLPTQLWLRPHQRPGGSHRPVCQRRARHPVVALPRTNSDLHPTNCAHAASASARVPCPTAPFAVHTSLDPKKTRSSRRGFSTTGAAR